MLWNAGSHWPGRWLAGLSSRNRLTRQNRRTRAVAGGWRRGSCVMRLWAQSSLQCRSRTQTSEDRRQQPGEKHPPWRMVPPARAPTGRDAEGMFCTAVQVEASCLQTELGAVKEGLGGHCGCRKRSHAKRRGPRGLLTELLAGSGSSLGQTRQSCRWHHTGDCVPAIPRASQQISRRQQDMSVWLKVFSRSAGSRHRPSSEA